MESEMDSYVTAFLAAGADPTTHAQLYHFTDPARDRYTALLAGDPTTAEEFRSTLRNYTRAYSFLAQVIAFHDPDLERLHLYGKALLQRLPRSHDANADLINRVFKDTETTAFFTQMARTIVYELARQAGQAS
jgi:type I restriction enzyme R subunit